MLKIVMATGNQGKLREMKELLADLPVEILSLKDFAEIPEPVEDGATFEANSLLKARYYMEKTGCAAMADDSGLEVEALGGAPGVHSARFAGQHGDDEANNEKLLSELRQRNLSESVAAHRCVLSYVGPDGRELTASGSCEGIVKEPRRGENGFGYDPYFYVTEGAFAGRTMAELTLAEKGTISHRARAMAKLKELLKENAL